MKQSTLAIWLKAIILGAALCGLVIYGLVLPELGLMVVEEFPGEADPMYVPWLVFLCAPGLPCYAALFCGWKIAGNIGRDRSFSMENARLFTWIAGLAAGDTAFFFLGNVVFLLINWSHPSVVLAALLLCFVGVAVTVAASVLSHLVQKAAALQEQSDLTI